jgi:hypothetical protein
MKDIIKSVDILKLPRKYRLYFALFCAKQVKHLCQHIPEAVNCLDLLERYLDGDTSVTVEMLEAAANAAYAYAYAAANAAYAAWAAAYAAVYAAGYAVVTAGYAACYAVATAGYAAAAAGEKEKIIEEQWKYYDELLNINENLEKAINT